MIYIEFESASIKNFISYGNEITTIDLNKFDTTLFLGKSGSGKSSWLDVISYALYGKPYRQIKLSQLINSINQKESFVSLRFKIGKKKYVIERGQKPKIFRVFCDGAEVQALDLQKYIEETILKFNFKIFKQVVALGYANFEPFLSLTLDDRRQLVDKLFDLSVFSMMSVLIKSEVTELQKTINDLSHKIDLNESKIDSKQGILSLLEQKAKSDKDNLRNQIQGLQKNLNEWNTAIEEYAEKVRELKKKLPDIWEISNKRSEFESQIKAKNGIVSSLTREIEEYRSYDVCSECGSPISKNKKQKEIEKRELKIADEQKELASLKDKLDKLIPIYNKVKKGYEKLDEYKASINKNTTIRDVAISQIKQLEEKLKEDNEAELSQHRIDLKALLANAKMFSVDQQKNMEKMTLLKTGQSILKDDGIKAEIIRMYIPKINSLMNRFLNEMDFFIHFELNENFEEKIMARGRDDFSYNNFSDGEQQRIDLAILFTWVKIAKMRSSVNTNLLILDEVLDSHLSPEAAENVISMLKSDLFSGTNVIVVSHKESVQDKFDNVINFEKRKEFSQIV